MKTIMMIGAGSLGVIVIALLMLAHHFGVERYQIVHAGFVAGTNVSLPAPGVICDSSQELTQAVTATNILEQAGMTSSDLDAPNLTAILASNHVVEEVLGQGGIGFIHVRSPTNGVSFTVIKGKKRLLQIAIAPNQ